MTCAKCGAEIPADAIICPNCGQILTSDDLKNAEEAEKTETTETTETTEAAEGTEETAPLDPAAEAPQPEAPDAPVDAQTDASDFVVLAPEDPDKPKKLGVGTVIVLVIVALAVICGVLFALSWYNIVRIPGVSSLTDAIKGVQTREGSDSSAAEMPEGYDPTATVLKAYGEEFDGAFFSLLYSSVANSAAQEAYYMSMYGQPTVYDSMKDPAEQTTTDENGDTVTYHTLFTEQTVAALEQTAYYDQIAKAQGLTLDDADRAELEEIVTNLKDSAEGEGQTLEEFLAKNFCPGVTEQTVRTYLEASMLAEKGKAYASEEYAKTLDAEALYAALEDNRDYLKIEFRMGYLAKTGEDEADAENRTRMEKILSELKDEETFTKTVYENLSEEDREQFADESATLFSGMTYSYVSGNIDGALAEWLFDGSRKAGDTTFIDGDGYFFVVMLTKPAYREDQAPVSVRHILVTFDSVAQAAEEGQPTAYEKTETLTASDGTEVSNEGTSVAGWVVLEAYEQAKAIYDEYLAGAKTEDAFAALANEKSQDPGSSSNGGLYENVTKGQMVKPFNDWCFDLIRKPGDTDMVMTSFGWHIMYFSGTADQPEWATALLAQAAQEHAAALQAEYTGKGERTEALAVAANAGLAVINQQIADYKAEMEAATATTEPVSGSAETTTLVTE